MILPPSRKASVQEELHETHPGIVRMKTLARKYFWWAEMDQDLEQTAKTCEACQQHAKALSHAPPHLWEWSCKLWARIHMDYAGPFMGKRFLVFVDAYSKWIDAYVVQTPTTQVTVEKLQVSFTLHGLSEVVMSNNGSCFTRSEFARFCAARGIVHITSFPYHPSSNGLAERAVQTLKQGLEKIDKAQSRRNCKLF